MRVRITAVSLVEREPAAKSEYRKATLPWQIRMLKEDAAGVKAEDAPKAEQTSTKLKKEKAAQ
jgi:hypothetical protein